MNITYYAKEVYGNELRYPVSRDAEMVCSLTETKTLTDYAIHIVKRHYPQATFEEVLKPRD